MSTGPKAILRVAAVTDPVISAESAERYARTLRERNGHDWPAGGRGGGRNAPHIQRHHAANLLMSFAAAAPVDGPRAVETLRALHLRTTHSVIQDENEKRDQQPDNIRRLDGLVRDERGRDPILFGDELEQLIQDEAGPTPDSHSGLLEIDIALSMEPPRAEIAKHYENGTITQIFAPPEEQPPSGDVAPKRLRPRRVFHVTWDLLSAAGAAWADTVRAGRAVPSEHPSIVERLEHAE